MRFEILIFKSPTYRHYGNLVLAHYRFLHQLPPGFEDVRFLNPTFLLRSIVVVVERKEHKPECLRVLLVSVLFGPRSQCGWWHQLSSFACHHGGLRQNIILTSPHGFKSGDGELLQFKCERLDARRRRRHRQRHRAWGTWQGRSRNVTRGWRMQPACSDDDDRCSWLWRNLLLMMKSSDLTSSPFLHFLIHSVTDAVQTNRLVLPVQTIWRQANGFGDDALVS